MSCSVYWKPVKNDGKYVGSGRFREILHKKFGYPAILTHSSLPYLEGLEDCGHIEAKILIEAIHENETIEIFLEC